MINVTEFYLSKLTETKEILRYCPLKRAYSKGPCGIFYETMAYISCDQECWDIQKSTLLTRAWMVQGHHFPSIGFFSFSNPAGTRTARYLEKGGGGGERENSNWLLSTTFLPIRKVPEPIIFSIGGCTFGSMSPFTQSKSVSNRWLLFFSRNGRNTKKKIKDRFNI